MKKVNKIAILIIALFVSKNVISQKQIILTSPNQKLTVQINIDNVVEYKVLSGNDVIIDRSPISMTLENGIVWGRNPRLTGEIRKSEDKIIASPYYKKSSVRDQYEEVTLNFKNNYNIRFRAYDEGIAYQFESTLKKPFIVKDEQATFCFPADYKMYVPYVNPGAGYETREKQLLNSFENLYTYINLSGWENNRLAFAPLLVECANGKKVVITEADLINYPGMYLYNHTKQHTLEGVFAEYPDAVAQNEANLREEAVLSRRNYIAECNRETRFPWRVIVVAQDDVELANNDMVYKLATPATADFSWVKPGKVSWEWWSAYNITGVDFRAGVNNETYKYHIDFASRYGLEYILMDEGWTDLNDLYKIAPQINLEELIAYGASKDVGIILWLPYYAFSQDIEGICRHYSKLGAKGFKIDFMDRDDQLMVWFHYHAAEIAAKYQLVIDYHGTYKPTGLQRTLPNVLNFEGVYGLENCKVADITHYMVTYDVTIPFIRMLAGPMDYTPGAMQNANKGNYRAIMYNPMSQGTRCRQLAQYIVFEAPLNMLSDSPTIYEREKECTEFIAAVPTIWDETIALSGKVAEYVAIARKKDNIWYLGAMTNWDKRELQLDFSFLGEGNFEAEIFRDHINSDRNASDYKKEILPIPHDKKINIAMAPGGGYAMKIYKK